MFRLWDKPDSSSTKVQVFQHNGLQLYRNPLKGKHVASISRPTEEGSCDEFETQVGFAKNRLDFLWVLPRPSRVHLGEYT